MPDSSAPLRPGETVWVPTCNRGFGWRGCLTALTAAGWTALVVNRRYAAGVANGDTVTIPPNTDVRRLEPAPGTTTHCQHCAGVIVFAHRLGHNDAPLWRWRHLAASDHRHAGILCPPGTPHPWHSTPCAEPPGTGYELAPLPVDLFFPSEIWQISAHRPGSQPRHYHPRVHTTSPAEVFAQATRYAVSDWHVTVNDPCVGQVRIPPGAGERPLGDSPADGRSDTPP